MIPRWIPALVCALSSAVFAAEPVVIEDTPGERLNLGMQPNASVVDGKPGTKKYEPLPKEAPFLKRITDKLAEGKSLFDGEKVIGREKGTEVMWFGIVRKITAKPEKGETLLLLENKFFDGMTDLSLQVVSLNGGGDFEAIIRNGPEVKIRPLTLVVVYGKIEWDGEGMPHIGAEYIRTWGWGQFAFMQYGTDASNQTWAKKRYVQGIDTYNAKPTRFYYEERVGAPEDYFGKK